MKGILSILLLIISNFFMTFAWYGHLQFKKWNIFQSSGLLEAISKCHYQLLGDLSISASSARK